MAEVCFVLDVLLSSCRGSEVCMLLCGVCEGEGGRGGGVGGYVLFCACSSLFTKAWCVREPRES